MGWTGTAGVGTVSDLSQSPGPMSRAWSPAGSLSAAPLWCPTLMGHPLRSLRTARHSSAMLRRKAAANMHGRLSPSASQTLHFFAANAGHCASVLQQQLLIILSFPLRSFPRPSFPPTHPPSTHSPPSGYVQVARCLGLYET